MNVIQSLLSSCAYHPHETASVCAESVAPEQDAEVQSQESDDHQSGEADNYMPASNDTTTEHDAINDVIQQRPEYTAKGSTLLDVFRHGESALTISVGDALRTGDDKAIEVILVHLALLRRASLRRRLNPNCKKAELEAL
jgi:hypothetical protein